MSMMVWLLAGITVYAHACMHACKVEVCYRGSVSPEGRMGCFVNNTGVVVQDGRQWLVQFAPSECRQVEHILSVMCSGRLVEARNTISTMVWLLAGTTVCTGTVYVGI